MARAYSDDLRGKVLAAYATGKGTLRELAEGFGVSYGWVANIHATELRTGSRSRLPQKNRGCRSRIDAELVRRLVGGRPDIVLHELRGEMLKTGTAISVARLARVLVRLRLRLEKVAPRHRARHRSQSSSPPSLRSQDRAGRAG